MPRVEGMLLQALELTLRREKNTKNGGSTPLIDDVSLHIRPGEMVVLAGGDSQSAGSSSTSALVQTLAGIRNPSDGDVLIDGLDLYKNLKAFRPHIGYVPRELSLHENLTVVETLKFEAQLLLPRDISPEAREQRVEDVLNASGLAEFAGRQARLLSPLNRRRLSIAVELLHQPVILLVDAAAEDLDPTAESQVCDLLKSLARQGYTVVQVTNESRCIRNADKVAVLTADGTLAWFGPPDEALEYFHESAGKEAAGSSGAAPAAATLPSAYNRENGQSERFDFYDVLWFLKQPQAEGGAALAKQFKGQPAYAKYLDDPLNDRNRNLQLQDRPLTRLRRSAAEKQPPPPVRQPSGMKKFSTLFARQMRLLTRDRTGRVMLLAPPLIALVDFLISSPTMLDPDTGDPGRLPVALGLLVFLNMLLAAMLFQPEVLKERPVFRREHRVVSLAMPYVLSKVWLVALLAVYQGLVWALVHFLAAGMNGFGQQFLAMVVTFILVAFTGGLLGVITSALVRSVQAASALALAVIVPQLLLSGAIIPLPQVGLPFQLLSVINPSRYAFEVLLNSSGYARDIAADPCWQFPPDARASIPQAQRQFCGCTGANVFLGCEFPGIHRSYSSVIEEPEPPKPTLDPLLLTHPAQPVYQAGQPVEEYVEQVNQYTLALEQFQGVAAANRSSTDQYMAQLGQWQSERSLAIGQAEELIAQAYERYGHSFRINTLSHWLIMAVMGAVLVFLLSMIQTRKGAGQ